MCGSPGIIPGTSDFGILEVPRCDSPGTVRVTPAYKNTPMLRCGSPGIIPGLLHLAGRGAEAWQSILGLQSYSGEYPDRGMPRSQDYQSHTGLQGYRC